MNAPDESAVARAWYALEHADDWPHVVSRADARVLIAHRDWLISALQAARAASTERGAQEVLDLTGETG